MYSIESVKIKILYLESFYSGSHKFFLDNLIKYSDFEIEKIVIEEKTWRLNYEKSALFYFSKIKNIENYDLIIASSLVDVSVLKGFYKTFPKVIIYWHENQFEYPNKKSDYLGLKDLHNFITADVNIFNSSFHKNDFFTKAKKEINKFNLFDLETILGDKYFSSPVIYPGFDMKNVDLSNVNPQIKTHIPIILWNHRWSKDKDYFMFFSMMRYLKKRDYKFKLNIFGEATLIGNKDFEYFKEQMGDYINKFGYLESKFEYYKEVLNSDIVISTAIEENFGISMVESMYMGLTPVLPNRLSYPELIPKEFHDKVLYKDYDDALIKLKDILDNKSYLNLSEYMIKYDVKKSVELFMGIIKNCL
jgi:glycosyltransferase involved in cell wall biosynthesis